MLCQAGVLLHGCHDSICGHETSCDADPCSETVIKESPLAKSILSTSPFLASSPFFAAVQAPVEIAIARSLVCSSHPLALGLSLPLLI